MNLLYHYTRLRIDLTRLMLVTLLERHCKGLESLSDDLSKILADSAMSELNKVSALMDYLALQEEELHLEFEENQLQDEFEELLREIALVLDRYKHRQYGHPKAVYLEFPDTVVFEYTILNSVPVQAPRRIANIQVKKRSTHI